MTKHIQVIRDEKGRPAYAVVPWPSFRALAKAAGEDAEDAALIALADKHRNDTMLPATVVDRVLGGVSPLKALREWRGLTQDQLAKRAGLSSQYISQVETGHRRGGGRKGIAALAHALNIGADELLELME